jgi:hypothetical protein
MFNGRVIALYVFWDSWRAVIPPHIGPVNRSDQAAKEKCGAAPPLQAVHSPDQKAHGLALANVRGSVDSILYRAATVTERFWSDALKLQAYRKLSVERSVINQRL